MAVLIDIKEVRVKRIFLGGTTHGTTWRRLIKADLLSLGVQPTAIVDPHLPKGIRYTLEYARWEDDIKEDPETIVLIHLCPANDADPALSDAERRYRNERVGPISCLEIGMLAFSEPHRTAVVLDSTAFTEGQRSRRIMDDIAARLRRKYGEGQPPLFESLNAVAHWAAPQLPQLVNM